MSPPITQVFYGLKGLYYWVKAELTSFFAKIDSKWVCVKGQCFRSLDDCIMFSQKHVPEGQFQWFLNIVSYLRFNTDNIIDLETSQISKIHEDRLCRTAKQSATIDSFRTSVSPVFAVPKELRYSIYPLNGVKNPNYWNLHDLVHSLFKISNK